MAILEMGLFKFLKLGFCVAVMVVGALNFTESVVYIHFDQTPPAWSRFSTAVFRYSVERPDGSNACRNNSCSIYCELDGQRLRPCHVNTIVLKNLTANHEHNFLLNVTTHNGEKNSSAYSWFIDTIPPTAIISSEQNYTSAEKITIDITFSEACTGHGGFKCVNSSNCDVTVDGPAHVQASSLSIIKPNIKYSLLLVLSLKSIYGRVVVRMAEDFCKDRAGNNFTRSNASTTIIHFDRRPVLVDLWSSVPSYELAINGVPRTVFATNITEELEVYLDFSIPVINSTEQILTALDVNSGSLIPVHERTHGNSRFLFSLKNIASETEIITVKLQAGLLIGRTGTPVSPVASLTFLYDCKKPGVGLSTSSQNVTKESNINVIVEFTKPVFGFEDSMIEVNGGRLIRQELSRALYSLTVLAVTNNMVSITIPEGKVNDVSGNMNMASNRLEIIHYSTPAISTALHSFVTAGVLATTLAAATLSLSSTNLGAIASNNFVASDPSMNLHGMIGHLQVFVLSDWLLADQSIEYSETTKGLRWLIPRQKLPWKKNDSSIWPNNVYLDQGNFVKRSSSWSRGYNSHERTYHDIDLDNSSYVREKLLFPIAINPKFSWLHGRRNISKKNTPFGLPLSSNEYFTYFLRGEPLSANNVVKKLQNYKGWQDMEMNLFWLSIGVGSLLIVHFVLLVFLRWRTGTAAQGILSVPRFELLLLILMLPCISQSSAFVIRGGTIGGIITGALLLVIPAAFILSICLFLTIAVFTGSLAQYKEIRHATAEEQWHKKLWFFFVGRPAYGKWFYMDGLPSLFLSRFGILFEDKKGPPLFVFVDQNDTNTMPRSRWVESGQNGIGRMRAVSSDDSHDEMKIPLSMRFLGCARSSYIILDLLRRVCLGVIAGSYSSHRSSQSLCALTITLGQFICLFTLKPHIRRGVYIVESISLLSEAGVFGLSMSMNKSISVRAKTLGFLMLALLFLSFVSQLVNEWHALIKCLQNLPQPHKDSFKLGLKFAAKGLLLPFLPRKHWSRVIPGSSQAKSVLVPVLPQSRETEFVRSDRREPRDSQLSSMTATVVPLLSPGSPIIQATGTTAETTLTVQKPGESTKGKGLKFDPKNDMKKLRELAKASFSGQSKDEETNTSYRFRLQSFSPETVSNDPQTSTSKAMK
ncbi:hypothetical protein CRYUN_Cryun15aG0007900 [Craigia yunnanensis]